MVSLALDPPPSARGPRPPRRGLLVVGLVATLLVGLGAGFWLGRTTTATGALASARKAATPAAAAPPPVAPAASPLPAAAAAAIAAPSTATPPVATAAPVPAAPAGPAVIPIPPAAANAPAQAPAPATPAAGPRRLSIALRGALEDSIAAGLPKEDRQHAEELTAVVNRLLVWDFHVSRDARKGDRLDVLWTPPQPAAPGLPTSGEPVVLALRYASSKLGTVIAAYRYEPKGARWARYYRPDGSELELRLVDAPIGDYEQVTSLLRDGRHHKGIDFKTPVGSPVVAPFDGVIERRNWHFSANGNCLDLRDGASGRHAIFLHLEAVPKEMQPGRKVRRGETIASSGNSGHSFAPHLHYQLEDGGGHVLDPFAVLRTERRSLAAGDKPAFDAARASLDAALSM